RREGGEITPAGPAFAAPEDLLDFLAAHPPERHQEAVRVAIEDKAGQQVGGAEVLHLFARPIGAEAIERGKSDVVGGGRAGEGRGFSYGQLAQPGGEGVLFGSSDGEDGGQLVGARRRAHSHGWISVSNS